MQFRMQYRFKASLEQFGQIVYNAVMASKPAGLGHLHFRGDGGFTPKQFMNPEGIDIDYIQGRMVKLQIVKPKSGWKTEWVVLRPNTEPDIAYQSWASKYPTFDALVASAGIPAGCFVHENYFVKGEVDGP